MKNWKLIIAFLLAMMISIVATNVALGWLSAGTWAGSSATYRYSYLPSVFNGPTDFGANAWNNVSGSSWVFTKVTSNADMLVQWGTVDGTLGWLAITQYARDANNYITSGTYIRYDMAENWYTGSANPGASQIDARSIAAHEFGHALGLAHTQSWNCGTPYATMCSGYTPGTTYKRSLESDDRSGIQALYP